MYVLYGMRTFWRLCTNGLFASAVGIPPILYCNPSAALQLTIFVVLPNQWGCHVYSTAQKELQLILSKFQQCFFSLHSLPTSNIIIAQFVSNFDSIQNIYYVVSEDKKYSDGFPLKVDAISILLLKLLNLVLLNMTLVFSNSVTKKSWPIWYSTLKKNFRHKIDDHISLMQRTAVYVFKSSYIKRLATKLLILYKMYKK